MQPKVEDLLADLLSKDRHRIWSASWGVVRLWDRQALCWLGGHSVQIKAATEGVQLGGGLRPNEEALSLALQRIDMAKGRTCFCSFYAKDMFFDPQREADEGFVEVLSKQDNAETWETDWRVACKSCGQMHGVTQNDGWHVPTYRWAASPR
jgi:hypothetical protein